MPALIGMCLTTFLLVSALGRVNTLDKTLYVLGLFLKMAKAKIFYYFYFVENFLSTCELTSSHSC
jgi:hypothetical protein